MLPYDDTFFRMDWSPSSWMWDTRDHIGHLAMTQVCLVGSHNAATYAIDRRSPFGLDAPGLLKKRGGVSCILRALGRRVSAPWARCQARTVLEQLRGGVRYLDLRVVPSGRHGGELYTTHSQLSAPLREVLRDVDDFLRAEGADEFIVLDFQHLFEMDDAAVASLASALSALSDRLVPARVPLSTPLAALWDASRRQRVFLVTRGGVGHAEARRRSGSVVSVWVNHFSLGGLLPALGELLRQDVKSGEAAAAVPERLYVTQAVLTPKAGAIARAAFSARPNGLRVLAEKNNSAILDWFCRLNAHAQMNEETVTLPRGMNTHSNILMVDFAEVGRCGVVGDRTTLDCVAACVNLNMLRAARCVSSRSETDSSTPREAYPARFVNT